MCSTKFKFFILLDEHMFDPWTCFLLVVVLSIVVTALSLALSKPEG
ncbi:MAG: hypothetical protein QXQ38_00960 [Archaeoglobaceae archaeon]|nr:hypothetical protein [Archaeoglobales archaeon]MDI9642409.1 hypothetical protein [Archaeoglobales archaeon]